MSVDGDGQAIVSGRDACRQLRLELGMAGVMGEMGQPGLSRTHFARGRDGLRHAEVRRMGRAEERIEHEHTYTPECFDRLSRQCLRIGDVAELADPVCVDANRPVGQCDGKNIDVANTYSPTGLQRVRTTFGLTGSWQRSNRFIEDVGEPLRQTLHGIGRAVHVDRLLSANGKCAYVVNALDVVCVVVGKKHGVDTAHFRRQQLQSKLRWGVDQDLRSTVCLDEGADTSAFVPGIRRAADTARATDLGNSKARTCPQERQLQRVSTLSRLVVPVMSKGTPAVTMILSPPDASSRLTTASFARCIISS